MKKLFKSIIAAMLCAIIAISAFGTETAYAAAKKMPLKVTVDGKSYTFTKNAKKPVKKVSIKKVKNALGEPTSTSKEYWFWDKEENGTSTLIRCFKNGAPYVEIDIAGEKNKDSVFGIKCGMSKKTVIKKLKKFGYKESELTVEPFFGSDTYMTFKLYDNDNYGRIWLTEDKTVSRILVRIYADKIS